MSDLNANGRIKSGEIKSSGIKSAGIKLGDALRVLPLSAPGRDVWPALAAQLAGKSKSAKPPRRMWRYGVPVALAAGLGLALVVSQSLRHPPTATVTTIATVAPANTSSSSGSADNDADMTNATNIQIQEGAVVQLAAAQNRSQALERWLRDTRHAASPLPSQDLVAATEIENLIGLVDVELASAPTRTLPLWQRRVALLEDLTALRYSNYRLAETASTTASIDTLNRIN
jgi:hypothetical protein